MTSECDRREALCALVSQPDPPELQRGHRQTQPGKPTRFALIPYLRAAAVTYRELQLQRTLTEPE